MSSESNKKIVKLLNKVYSTNNYTSYWNWF
jgi:hypothetical protein